MPDLNPACNSDHFHCDRYPDDWEDISDRIRFDRADGRCECEGQCGDVHPDGRCRAEHGEPHPVTGSEVVLTVAHWPDDNPQNTDAENLHAMCQRCHLNLDAGKHARSARYGRHHDGAHQLNLDLIHA